MKIVDRWNDVLVLKGERFADDRGSFEVTSAQDVVEQLVGHPVQFKQLNTVRTKWLSGRGLHYNVTGLQAKLVTAISGIHFCVAVDVRKGSETAGLWFGDFLSLKTSEGFWVPPGFAHGTVCCCAEGILQYQSTTLHDPANERSLALDSDVDVKWPYRVADMTVKPGDLAIKTLKEFWSTYE